MSISYYSLTFCPSKLLIIQMHKMFEYYYLYPSPFIVANSSSYSSFTFLFFLHLFILKFIIAHLIVLRVILLYNHRTFHFPSFISRKYSLSFFLSRDLHSSYFFQSPYLLRAFHMIFLMTCSLIYKTTIRDKFRYYQRCTLMQVNPQCPG